MSTIYNRAQAITKSDTVDIETVSQLGATDAVYVGGAGVVAAVFKNGFTAEFTCVAGQILPVAVKRVNSTNTTATLLIALYVV